MDIFATRDKEYVIHVSSSGKILQETFLPLPLFGKSKSLPPIVGTLSMMPVKKSVLGLQDQVTSANYKYLSLICASSELIGAV